MRITQEADYAIRICAALAQAKGAVSAPQLSKDLGIPPRFASKTLRELMQGGLVRSVRGVNGGFLITKEPETISLLQIIEAIDGKIAIRHCLTDDYNCSFQANHKKCRFHRVFEEVNNIITNCFRSLTLSDMIDESISIDEIIKGLHNVGTNEKF